MAASTQTYCSTPPTSTPDGVSHDEEENDLYHHKDFQPFHSKTYHGEYTQVNGTKNAAAVSSSTLKFFHNVFLTMRPA